jgi:DNA-directed RNA polymerase specialized sigma24 family protein
VLSRIAVEEALRALTADEACIVRVLFDGLTQDQVATAEGVTLGEVRKRKRRVQVELLQV